MSKIGYLDFFRKAELQNKAEQIAYQKVPEALQFKEAKAVQADDGISMADIAKGVVIQSSEKLAIIFGGDLGRRIGEIEEDAYEDDKALNQAGSAPKESKQKSVNNLNNGQRVLKADELASFLSQQSGKLSFATRQIPFFSPVDSAIQLGKSIAKKDAPQALKNGIFLTLEVVSLALIPVTGGASAAVLIPIYIVHGIKAVETLKMAVEYMNGTYHDLQEMHHGSVMREKIQMQRGEGVEMAVRSIDGVPLSQMLSLAENIVKEREEILERYEDAYADALKKLLNPSAHAKEVEMDDLSRPAL